MAIKDQKRTVEAKVTTLSIRTVRKNRTTEQRFTDRQYSRLLTKGL
jgi:hypothetical protein